MLYPLTDPKKHSQNIQRFNKIIEEHGFDNRVIILDSGLKVFKYNDENWQFIRLLITEDVINSYGIETDSNGNKYYKFLKNACDLDNLGKALLLSKSKSENQVSNTNNPINHNNTAPANDTYKFNQIIEKHLDPNNYIAKSSSKKHNIIDNDNTQELMRFLFSKNVISTYYTETTIGSNISTFVIAKCDLNHLESAIEEYKNPNATRDNSTKQEVNSNNKKMKMTSEVVVDLTSDEDENENNNFDYNDPPPVDNNFDNNEPPIINLVLLSAFRDALLLSGHLDLAGEIFGFVVSEENGFNFDFDLENGLVEKPTMEAGYYPQFNASESSKPIVRQFKDYLKSKNGNLDVENSFVMENRFLNDSNQLMKDLQEFSKIAPTF